MLTIDEEKRDQVLDELERTRWKRVGQTLIKDWRLYALLAPLMIFLILFRYLPIIGILEAFRFAPPGSQGGVGAALELPWTGLQNFHTLFSDAAFWVAVRNTFVISMYGLIFGFPVPIILALLFSEVKSNATRTILQLAVYLPRFISTVVITSIIWLWSSTATPAPNASSAGLLTQLLYNWGVIPSLGSSPLSEPRLFRSIFQITGIWEGAGFGSIVFFAAVMAISPTNYEAAKIDGATKMQQIRYVTLPGMAPTLIIMLIMRIGTILSVGFETVFLLYNQNTLEVADVIATYVIRRVGAGGGSAQGTPGIAVAADLFNSLIAMCLVLGANAISRRVSDTSLF